MIKRIFIASYLACLTLVSSTATIQAQFNAPSHTQDLSHEFEPLEKSQTETQSSLISSVTAIAPGAQFQVALKLKQPSGWHSYYHNDGIGISQSPSITWTLPEGFTASPLIFPTPHQFDSFGLNTYGYEGTHYFITNITVPTDITPGKAVTLTAESTWQLCKVSCKNEKGQNSIQLSCSSTAVPNPTFISELDDYQKKYIPVSKVPENWAVTASDIDKNIKIKINADKDFPYDLKFYEYNGQLDAQKPIEVSSLGKKATIKGFLNEGNEFSSSPVEKLDHIRGILHSPSTAIIGDRHSVFITAKWEPNKTPTKFVSTVDETIVTNSEDHSSQQTSELSSIQNLNTKEIAEKYDTDSKISIITLDRIDDEGNALDDEGKIIAKEDLFTDAEGNITNAEGKIIGVIQKTTFLWASLLIFGGGLILNLMPCVFPVLGIKVLGFVQLAGNDPKKIKMHGIVFTLGVIVSMWILAAIILIIRDSTGQGVAWGNQMKNPIFVGCMIILMALFALNLYGVFEVGTSLTSAGGKLHAKKGYEGSFFSGVLTTLIATPCGAPLLATAMTYTLQQTVPLAMILFTIFGLGVASPYLVLSFFPALINKLPRPGNWMVTFKKSMSFLLLATVVFLMSAFVAQTGTEGIILMLWALVILATAAFIYGTWGTPIIAKVKRYLIGYGLALAFTFWGGSIAYRAMSTEVEEPAAPAITAASADDIHSWTNWAPGLVDHHRSKKRIVWIDYTADW